MSVYLYNSKNQNLSIKDYLKQEKLYQEKKMFKLSSYQGTFEEQLKEFIAFINNVLKENMYDI